ncbi:hypothetical protein L7F22_054353 [Adiantum nelumboides]|nr:hypothetical protein [Adiantum nelumboides]
MIMQFRAQYCLAAAAASKLISHLGLTSSPRAFLLGHRSCDSAPKYVAKQLHSCPRLRRPQEASSSHAHHLMTYALSAYDHTPIVKVETSLPSTVEYGLHCSRKRVYSMVIPVSPSSHGAISTTYANHCPSSTCATILPSQHPHTSATSHPCITTLPPPSLVGRTLPSNEKHAPLLLHGTNTSFNWRRNLLQSISLPNWLQGPNNFEESAVRYDILVEKLSDEFIASHSAPSHREAKSNAGGSSILSETLSIKYLVKKFQAKDVAEEMDVQYSMETSKKIDYICTLYGKRVGVSVTRAMSFPNPIDFSPKMAQNLLLKKLSGIVVARQGVSPHHSFSESILHVWCETQEIASIMQTQYNIVSKEIHVGQAILLMLTVADTLQARSIFYELIPRANNDIGKKDLEAFSKNLTSKKREKTQNHIL